MQLSMLDVKHVDFSKRSFRDIHCRIYSLPSSFNFLHHLTSVFCGRTALHISASLYVC